MSIFSILNVLLVMAILGLSTGQDSCSGEDYAPCICLDFPGNLRYVQCQEVAIEKVAEIFRRTSTVNIEWLELYISSNDEFVPANVLSDKRVSHLTLYGPSNDYRLQVDVNAFNSTRDYTLSMAVYICDLSLLDFTFLTGFNELVELNIKVTTNIHLTFRTLPPLKNLSSLYIEFNSELPELIVFPILSNGLTTFSLKANDPLDDLVMDKMLNWVLASSANKLEKLILGSNELTEIPKKISSFIKLKDLLLDYNQVPLTIAKDSLSFSTPVTSLYFYNGRVNVIEPGAFQGDFSSTLVYLNNNNLTRFESSVFQNILEQMNQKTSDGGYVWIAENPFDCITDLCHLAWLIRDNGNLLNRVLDGKCSNGTSFNDLNPSGFSGC